MAAWAPTTAERALLGAPLEEAPIAPLVRVDAIPTGAGLRILEVNTLFSGLASSDVLARSLAGLAALRPDLESAAATPVAATSALARCFAGNGPVALLGRPPSDPIAEEYRCTAAELRRHGLADIACASIGDLASGEAGEVMMGGRRIGSLYLRGSYSDWLADLAAMLADAAWRAGRIRMVGPLAGLLADSKAALAAIDRRNSTIDALTPETLPLNGADVTLKKRRVLAAQAGWVLKPSDGFGGAGVVVGHAVTRSRWEDVVARAGPRWIAQRYEPQPSFVANGVRWWFNLNLVIVAGELVGGFARLSPHVVANIARSGLMVPLFVGRAPCATEDRR